MLQPNQEFLFTRQRHEADRAGLHYDYRFVVGDKAYSFATKKEMPEPGKSIVLFEQPVHDSAYALSERVVIPKGQYGAGLTTLDTVKKAKTSDTSTEDKLVFNTKDGQRFLLKKAPGKYGDKAWLFRNLTGVENKYKTKSDGLVKKAEAGVYAHTTSDIGLQRILDSGKIMTVQHLARYSPDSKVNVELLPGLPFFRKTLTAEAAYDAMKGLKNPHKVFLTRDGYVGNYGGNVILKSLSSPSERLSLSTIPNEYTTGRALSIRSNADIYVPDTQVASYQEKYPNLSFKPKSELPVSEFSIADRISHYPDKIYKAFSFSKEAQLLPIDPRAVSHNAMLVGSTGLGLNLDNTDVDIFVPYKNRHHYERAVERIKAKFPELQERASTLKNLSKTTLSGKVNGTDMDVVLGMGPKALSFRDAYLNALHSLSPEEKIQILARKKALKESWFMPETRYKSYKNELADKLGLKQHYF